MGAASRNIGTDARCRGPASGALRLRLREVVVMTTAAGPARLRSSTADAVPTVAVCAHAAYLRRHITRVHFSFPPSMRVASYTRGKLPKVGLFGFGCSDSDMVTNLCGSSQ